MKLGEILAFAPMIGGVLVAIIAVIMDAKQKQAKKIEQTTITNIISTENMPLEEMVKSILKIQLQHQKKNQWMERIIGFLMGIAGSLIVAIILYYLGFS